jgi:hypothetical protein
MSRIFINKQDQNPLFYYKSTNLFDYADIIESIWGETDSEAVFSILSHCKVIKPNTNNDWWVLIYEEFKGKLIGAICFNELTETDFLVIKKVVFLPTYDKPDKEENVVDVLRKIAKLKGYNKIWIFNNITYDQLKRSNQFNHMPKNHRDDPLQVYITVKTD